MHKYLSAASVYVFFCPEKSWYEEYFLWKNVQRVIDVVICRKHKDVIFSIIIQFGL